MKPAPGMTLVEVLVVMVVAGILTALVVMGLRRTKSQTSDLQNVSNIRLSMQDFLAWSAEHEERWPTIGLPSHRFPMGLYSRVGVAAPNAGEISAALYFGMATAWPHILAEWKGREEPYWYEQGGPDLSFAENWPPSSKPVGPFTSKIRYSDAMRTTPDLWVWPGRRAQTFSDLLRFGAEVRTSQVRSPGSKGILLFLPSTPGRAGGEQMFVGFADGAADARSASSAKQTAAHPFTGERGLPVLATLRGFEGVDF